MFTVQIPISRFFTLQLKFFKRASDQHNINSVQFRVGPKSAAGEDTGAVFTFNENGEGMWVWQTTVDYRTSGTPSTEPTPEIADEDPETPKPEI